MTYDFGLRTRFPVTPTNKMKRTSPTRTEICGGHMLKSAIRRNHARNIADIRKIVIQIPLRCFVRSLSSHIDLWSFGVSLSPNLSSDSSPSISLHRLRLVRIQGATCLAYPCQTMKRNNEKNAINPTPIPVTSLRNEMPKRASEVATKMLPIVHCMPS